VEELSAAGELGAGEELPLFLHTHALLHGIRRRRGLDICRLNASMTKQTKTRAHVDT